MVSERDRILSLVKYIESFGIQVNIGKNKARGNKGYFQAKSSEFRIDIAKNLPDRVIIQTLAHEFAHFVHFSFDKTLKKLDFIFPEPEEIYEELLAITVDAIPKEQAEALFEKKKSFKDLINNSAKLIKECYSDFKPTSDYEPLEKKIKKTPLKYLLKYDRVKVFEGLFVKYYSIDDLNNNTCEEIYLRMKSYRRNLNRINSRISKLNRYYNSPTELFARSFELYSTNPEKLMKIAPKVYSVYNGVLQSNKIPMLTDFVKILKK